MSAPFVWVAHVPTYYRVVGVGNTRDEAVRVACQRAWEFLDDRDCLTEETSTPEKVAEWFGVGAVCVEIGEGVFYE